MKLTTKLKFKNWMKRRISFRFHMSLLMLATIVLGVVSNYLLLNFGVTHPALRFPVTIILSYSYFLFLMHFYIQEILKRAAKTSVLDHVDAPDVGGSPDFNLSSSASPEWVGEGGGFSGGGSSGSWGDSVPSVDIGDADEGAIVFVVLGGVVLALVFGTGAYFIWNSPEILSECILQVLLVSGLQKKLRSAPVTEWFNHIFKATKWPFIFVLCFSVIFGAILRGYCPEANHIREVMVKCN